MFGIGPPEMMIVGVIALLLFGNRLPEVARSFGKSMTEFKRGLSGVQDEFNDAVHAGTEAAQVDYSSDYDSSDDDQKEPATPKFVPPTSPPADE